MGIFDVFKKKNRTPKPANHPMYLYTEEELDEYDSYIEASLGSFEQVYHEIASPDIHLDVIPILPDEECPYYRLVTMGAGAYRMHVPEQYKDHKLEYAEYMIFLPPDWNLDSADEKDFWPMHQLKNIARLPIYSESWLAYGHTISADEEGSPFAENTKLNCILLVTALDQYGRRMQLKLSSGKKINFYQLIPIYEEELAYKQEHGADALVDLLSETPGFPVVDMQRKNVMIDNAETKGEER